MTAIRSQRMLTICASAALAVVAVGLALLLLDAVAAMRRAPAGEALLADLEIFARADAAAATEFQAVVDEQTVDSLDRRRWRRGAAILTLSAAALFVTLFKARAPRTLPVPQCVLARVRAPREVTPDEQRDTDVHWQIVAPVSLPAVDLAPVDQLVRLAGRRPEDVIPLLHAIERQYRYLPQAALERVCETTQITPAAITGVASFFSQFRRRPRGRHVLRVCHGTACHVAGACRVIDEFRRQLGIAPDQDTDPACDVTIEEVACLGCCTLAPVMQLDGHTTGCAGIDMVAGVVAHCRAQPSVNGTVNHADQYGLGRPAARRALAANGRGAAEPLEIRVGVGSCCVAGGSAEVVDALERELAATGHNAVVKRVGCVGMCHLTPLVEIVSRDRDQQLAVCTTPSDARRVIRALPDRRRATARIRQRLSDLWPVGGKAPESTECRITRISEPEVAQFLGPQVRIVTEHSGRLNPLDLAEYRAHDGLAALERCVGRLQPEEVIDLVERSGLRGRGGGGFPTGDKWRLVRRQSGNDKVVICNGDEGDPGAFMDRMILESYPYRVIEGLAIAAYAVGARQAVLYIRQEYGLAVERIRAAIARLEHASWLGSHVLGSGFALDVRVFEGAGAFVCGEETALLESLMGRRGTPRYRPPYPAEQGLWNQPTLVNNVETLATVPWIVRHGPDRFAQLGTRSSRGTKVFSLSGKVRRGGLIEIPLGLPIRDVVERIGGGVRGGKKFKAVQIGGPSGGCVPASLADTPIDYEALRDVGAIMGSGGLVVLDEDDCMVDVARYFLEFTERESCGRCTFCRIGTRRLLDVLERICAGEGRPGDLDRIESLAASTAAGSLCGLGKTAPNPVITTLRYFRDEYQAHLEGRCPAGRCPALVRYEVTDQCTGCTLCAQHCPVGAIPATPYRRHVIDPAICTRCDLCRETCPEEAIIVV